MAHPSRSTPPLDVLQSTLDGIFIEIGKSLRISDKVAPKTLVANANARLRSTIPRAIETFHQALDDIEAEIVRAKAVMLRDLEEARAKRIAAENPPPEPVEEPVNLEPTADVPVAQDNIPVETGLQIPPPAVEDPAAAKSLEGLSVPDPLKDVPANGQDVPKEGQTLSPPGSDVANFKSDTGDLAKEASSVSRDLDTAGIADSSVDFLLDISADNNNHDDLNMNFDGMDFGLLGSNGGETSQSQSNDFDLSTFGNNLESFHMPDLHTSNNTETLNDNTENKKDDLFSMVNDTMEDDVMDLDLMRPAEESSFDELFSMGGDGDMSVGDSMDHDGYSKNF